MTDPLSVITGVAGIISLAGAVIGQCYRYGCGVSGAPEEAKRLVSEVTGLSGVLVGVQSLVKQSDLPGYQIANSLKECKIVLETLSSNLRKYSPGSSSSSGKRVMNRLLWPLRKTEMEELISTLERHKNSLSLSLDSLSVEALMSQSASLEGVSDAISQLSADIKTSTSAQERTQVLDWLSEHQYEAQFRRSCQIHCSDTCKWLLDHPEFIHWSQCRSSLLWMHGQAGSGKTIATSYLINHLANEQESDGSLLGYFYYDASTIESLTPETFFGAILKQFCSGLHQLPDEVLSAYKRASCRFGTPKQASLGELQSLLLLLLERHNSAKIIIDGLDESRDYAVVSDFLTSTILSGRYALLVFVSSRPEMDLRRRFQQFRQLSVPELSVEEDISLYIKMRISTDPRLRRMSEKMKQYVEMTLRTDSHGMFRWVQCQLDEISRLRTDAAVKRALNMLPASIEDSYSRILRNISQEDSDFAKRTLLWLAYASTPLSLPELAEAVILDPGFVEINPDCKLNDPNDVLEICASLVTFNQASKTARIAHHSVREFLTGRLTLSSEFFIPAQASHLTIAETCISYLLLDDFSAGPLYQAEFTWTLSNYPLLRYAAQNWTFHVQMSGAEGQLLPLILQLMTTRSNPKFLFWLQVVLHDSKHGFISPSKDLEQARPLYYAASYGLTETVRRLVEAGADLNERAGRFGGTALHAAVWRDRPEVLRILINAGADLNIQDYNGATPAELALWSGKRGMYKAFSNNKHMNQDLAELIGQVLQNREKALSISAEEWELAQQYATDAVEGPLRVMNQIFDHAAQEKITVENDVKRLDSISSQPRHTYTSAKEPTRGQIFELG